MYYQARGICFSQPSTLGPICRPSVLGPLTPQILSLEIQVIGYKDQDEALKLPTKMYLSSKIKNTLSIEELFLSYLYKVYFPPSHLSAPASR